LEKAARTQQEEKRRLYARLLTNAAGPEWVTKPDMAEELLETLAELSPRDVIILTRLKDLYRTLPGRGQSPHNLKPHFPDLMGGPEISKWMVIGPDLPVRRGEPLNNDEVGLLVPKRWWCFVRWVARLLALFEGRGCSPTYSYFWLERS